MVDQEISQHRVAEGSADERCHHRVSQGRAPLSQTESAKESGHYRRDRRNTLARKPRRVVGELRSSSLRLRSISPRLILNLRARVAVQYSLIRERLGN